MPTFRITSADERGVPVRAQCDDCGFKWRRPAGDPIADSLPIWGRMHRCKRHEISSGLVTCDGHHGVHQPNLECEDPRPWPLASEPDDYPGMVGW
jgi:hypothetical protein